MRLHNVRKGASIGSSSTICIVKSIAFSWKCYDMLNMRKVPDGNRSKLEIIAQILREVRLPTGKTSIMSHCNMSFAQSGNYLNLMRSSDLVHLDANAGRVTYQRTDAGRAFLGLYEKMASLLDTGIPVPLPI